jgi:hypothetical protein
MATVGDYFVQRLYDWGVRRDTIQQTLHRS